MEPEFEEVDTTVPKRRRKKGPLEAYDIPISLAVSDYPTSGLIGERTKRPGGSPRPATLKAQVTVKILDAVPASVDKDVAFLLTGYMVKNGNLIPHSNLLDGLKTDPTGKIQNSNEGFILVEINWQHINPGTYYVRAEVTVLATDTGKSFARYEEIFIRFEK